MTEAEKLLLWIYDNGAKDGYPLDGKLIAEKIEHVLNIQVVSGEIIQCTTTT